MVDAVLPPEACEDNQVADPNYKNIAKCLLNCFRKRETFRHGIKLSTFPSAECGVSSCAEMLAAARMAYHNYATGGLMRTVTIGDKQYTNNAVDKACLEKHLIDLEYECGKYCKSKQASCATECSPCGCTSKQSCSSCCSKPTRIFCGYL